MGREVVVFAVLKDEDAALFQQCFLEDEVRDCGQLLQRIGRVGKDEVVLLPAGLDEAENIATDRNQGERFLISRQLLDTLLDKTVVVAVQFYADHLTATTAEQFQ